MRVSPRVWNARADWFWINSCLCSILLLIKFGRQRRLHITLNIYYVLAVFSPRAVASMYLLCLMISPILDSLILVIVGGGNYVSGVWRRTGAENPGTASQRHCSIKNLRTAAIRRSFRLSENFAKPPHGTQEKLRGVFRRQGANWYVISSIGCVFARGCLRTSLHDQAHGMDGCFVSVFAMLNRKGWHRWMLSWGVAAMKVALFQIRTWEYLSVLVTKLLIIK